MAEQNARRLQVVIDVLSVLTFVLILTWIFYFHKEISWIPAKGEILVHVWNAHPIFMVAGFICLLSQAIVRGRGESSTKTSGASSGASYHVTQVAALLLGYIGIAFAYRYKALAGLFHLYSLHSWLGLVATAGLTAQVIRGIVLFYKGHQGGGSKVQVWEVKAGVLIYILMLTTAIIGAQEKIQILEVRPPGETELSRWSYEGVFLSSTVVIMLALGFVVLYKHLACTNKDREEAPTLNEPLLT